MTKRKERLSDRLAGNRQLTEVAEVLGALPNGGIITCGVANLLAWFRVWSLPDASIVEALRLTADHIEKGKI